jgi:hypothetical protein
VYLNGACLLHVAFCKRHANKVWRKQSIYHEFGALNNNLLLLLLWWTNNNNISIYIFNLCT